VDAKAGRADDAAEAEAASAAAATPTKIVTSTVTVTVSCALLYLDFEGRSDARSIKMILQHMAPLQVALVHGSKAATEVRLAPPSPRARYQQ
jgi:cleavage and polyadenylation specificity factor subunit 2